MTEFFIENFIIGSLYRQSNGNNNVMEIPVPLPGISIYL